MASNAVNAKSFINYVVSLLKYRSDGTALSSANKQQAYNFLSEGISNPSIAININTAQAILNKLRTVIGQTTKTISISKGTGESILSVNSAKQIVSVMLPTDIRNRFTTFNKIWNSTDATSSNAGNYLISPFVRVDASSAQILTISGTLIGGGGGGSGAIGGDGDKNASYTVVSGAGGKGEDSYIEINGTRVATVSGGGGGSSLSQKAGGNPSFAVNGNNGNAGSRSSISINISPKDRILIYGGCGGGGGAGCSATAGGTTGGKTWYGGSGDGKNGGSAVATANEWSGEDGVFNGAGGGGGGLAIITSTGVGEVGSSGRGPSSYGWMSGPSGTIGAYNNPMSGTTLYGGWGAFTDNCKQNTSPPRTLGIGGNGGKAQITTDVSVWACGGYGGNRGGFIIDSACSGANALMAITYK